LSVVGKKKFMKKQFFLVLPPSWPSALPSYPSCSYQHSPAVWSASVSCRRRVRLSFFGCWTSLALFIYITYLFKKNKRGD